jgi:outer membrane immunogenic protein
MLRNIIASTAIALALGGSAVAADLPSREAPPVYVPPPPIFTWTGLYLGGEVGYQWGDVTKSSFNSAGAFAANEPTGLPTGVVGGAHIGYNWQMSQIVIGLEGDVEGSSLHSSSVDTTGVVSTSAREPFEASIRGRVGFAWDRALIYGTGGAAFGSLHNTATNLTTGGVDTFDTSRVGWTVGGGVEYAVSNNWSIRAEYRYTDLGNFTDTLTNSTGAMAGGPFAIHIHNIDNAVRAGFSYKFDPPPPVAPVTVKY